MVDLTENLGKKSILLGTGAVLTFWLTTYKICTYFLWSKVCESFPYK